MRSRSSAIFLLLAVTFCSESQNPAPCGEGTPIISSLSPSSSCPTGNIPVDILGENNSNATSVSFAGEDVEFTVIDPNTIRTVAPSHPVGLIEVSITTCSGIVSYVGFQYEADPMLSGVTPVEGCNSGGTEVILSGSVLKNVTDVTFCGNPALGFNVVSSDQINAVSPPCSSTGPADLAVATSCGTSALPGAFTYLYSPPVDMAINSVEPGWSCTGGGAVVTFSGIGLTGVSSVAFGQDLVSPTGVDPMGMSITAVTPSHAGGTVDVSAIVGTCGFATLTSGFTFTDPPSLASLAPTTGSTVGGEYVEITGSYFSSSTGSLVTGVTFGGADALSFTVVSGELLTAETPSHGSGQVEVMVEGICGNAVLTDWFTYILS